MNRIKQLRNELNITQQELADKINCAKCTIAMYENGKRKPSIKVLFKLSKIFDCSIDYILGKSSVRSTEVIELSNIEIAFATGMKGLNKENQQTLKKIIDGLLLQQQNEDTVEK